MAVFVYPVLALVLLWLFFRLWRLRKSSDIRAAGVLSLQVVIFVWVLDFLIIAVGRFLGESDFLERLSQVRWLLRTTFVPLLMVTVLDFAARSEVKWAEARLIRILIWGIALMLTILGGVLEWQLMDDLIVRQVMGTAQYLHSNSVPPFLSLLTYLVIAIFGVLIWRKVKWVWVLVGGLVAFVVNIVAQTPAWAILAAGAGVFLLWCLVATEGRLQTPDYSLSEVELSTRISQVKAGRSKKKS